MTDTEFDRGLEFRKVISGITPIPKECCKDGKVISEKLMKWFCPSLTDQEASFLGEIAERRMIPINKEATKALIFEFIRRN